jgi:hypothetical protein
MKRFSLNAEVGDLNSCVVFGVAALLQTGMSRVPFSMGSMDFSVHLILSAALWPWGVDSASNRNE